MNIIFNGPPGSGKDEACEFIESNYGFKHLIFKEELLADTIKLFNVSQSWFMNGYQDRSTKEQPENELGGLSRREALIHTSENVMKKKFGSDYYGQIVAEKMDGISSYCFSDSGFKDEILPVINTVGSDNICIIQLFRDGCSFKKDSRNYLNGQVQDEFILGFKSEKLNVGVPEFHVRSYQIHNNDNIENFHKIIRTIIRRELNVKPEKEAFPRKSI
jgi:hypothetical protein